VTSDIGGFRPRRPEDGSDPDVPVAATVVIVRDSAAGPEVLMTERPDRGSFAGAWVFPGGKLEPADRDGTDVNGTDVNGTDVNGTDVNGADEHSTDEKGADEHSTDEARAARRAGARETWEETGLRVDAGAFVPLSRWDPPPGIRLRIRTWFFLVGDPGGELTLAPDEVINAEWVRPADMLARHGRGELTLYPPTWVTLHELADQPDAAAMVGFARIGGFRRFETVARRGAEGTILLWEGDAAYNDAAYNDAGTADVDGVGNAEDAASRHRLEIAALPWIYTRTD
jgi:8-oxo-dGTP pyrophosphatase MutT (NUDIX family)